MPYFKKILVIGIFLSFFNVSGEVNAQTHPSALFQDISETPGYQNSSISPWKEWKTSILSNATSSVKRDFSLTFPNYWEDNIGARGQMARDLGLAYQITKNMEYAIKAKEAILNMAVGTVDDRMEAYIRDNRQLSLVGYALAYDWIQPTLDSATDILIRDKLAALAETVYKDCNKSGTSMYGSNFGQQGQSYPTLGVVSAILNDYTNPNNIAITTNPSMWHTAGKEYLFENDLLHSFPNRSMLSWGFDETFGKYYNGSYKIYSFDDMALWFQVSNYFYHENFLEMYPLAKKAFTSEIWESLPNHYSDNFVTNSNSLWTYHKAIVSLFPDNEKSIILNHTDRADLAASSQLVPYVYVTAGGSQGGLSAALFYCTYPNYSSIPRYYPETKSRLHPDAITQLIRGSWNDDADWMSMVTFNEDTGSNRDLQHHDQMAFEYYSKGDLLLADAGEDRIVQDAFYGTGIQHHNTIALENPRAAFPFSQYMGTSALGPYKGDAGGVDTIPTVETIIQTPWLEAVRARTNITKVSLDTTIYAAQNLTSPINYDRTMFYPDSDYFIVFDRMEGTEAWKYRNIFRPTSFNVARTVSSGSTYDVGHVNGNLIVGNQSFNWLSLTYKTETDTGVNTNSIKWNTTNLYGNAVELNIYSVPSSDVKINKFITRIGGSGAASEVYLPLVLLTTPASQNMYRATALLSSYSTEAKKTGSQISVTGTGNAMKVSSSNYQDYIYTGKATSSFEDYTTDADIAYIRYTTQPSKYTILNGSFVSYQGIPLVSLSQKVNYLTLNKETSKTTFKVSGSGTTVITLKEMTSETYTITRDGSSYSNFQKSGTDLIITTDLSEHQFEIFGSGYIPPSDTTAPSQVTNLSVSNITQTSVTLNWTAPGDDGTVGTAASYDIRYSTAPITSSNWASAIQAGGEPIPQISGTDQSFATTGLTANTTYYFAIKAVDELNNISSLSNIASGKTLAAITTDTTAPTRSNGSPTGILAATTTQTTISLLTDESATCKYSTAAGTAYSSMTGTFTTTGGLSHSKAITGLTSGTSYAYYVRCTDSSNNINATDFTISFSVASPSCNICGLGTPVINPASPLISQAFTLTCPTNASGYDCINAYANASSGQCAFSSYSGNNAVFSCTGLAAGTYIPRCVAVTGTSRNCCSAAISGSYTISAVADTAAPSQITNLASYNPTQNSISLAWTAPGDDGTSGTANQYDVRHSTVSINSSNWTSSAQAIGEPTPQVSGTSQTYTVTGLTANTTYYFAIKSIDDSNNVSPLSNIVSGTTAVASAPATTTPAIPTNPVTTPTTTASIAQLQALIQQLLAQVAQLQAQLAVVQGIPVQFRFQNPLYIGLRNDDTRQLQTFLASQGTAIYPEAKITGYFGILTRKAVIRFQLKYGIVASEYSAGAGLVGPKTRTKINEMLGK
ncbi:MAG: hypothetical protein E4H16_00035 [Candidatus Atribacteria bacterium]|nr:MAG: hypothetical protein E4H16_00035 [Candidatus Atribacteria bacterium]